MSNQEDIRFDFTEMETNSPAFVYVRELDDGKKVGLTLSIQDDGDIEVFMDSQEFRRLLETLNSKFD